VNQSQGSFSLIKEMLESTDVISSFRSEIAHEILDELLIQDRVLFTGEGSSRIFPAKHAISKALSLGLTQHFHTEASYQANEVNLDGWVTFGASNSGRTKELVLLFRRLKERGQKTIAVTATADSPLEKTADHTFVLSCGKEKAVAATKSVIEEALFYDSYVSTLAGKDFRALRNGLAKESKKVLSDAIAPKLIEMGAKAPRIYFSGRNNGVAEELMLKTMEIVHKPAFYMEGTFALHGIEEIMQPSELVVIVEPFEREEERFDEILRKGVGMNVIAISSRKTRFPTIQIPHFSDGKSYLQLMAGWNFLVHIGLHLGLNIDKPKRARKVGNEI
jgi:glucosamine--fructose-6-phosphate aminotransferase (isomerizing)